MSNKIQRDSSGDLHTTNVVPQRTEATRAGHRFNIIRRAFNWVRSALVRGDQSDVPPLSSHHTSVAHPPRKMSDAVNHTGVLHVSDTPADVVSVRPEIAEDHLHPAMSALRSGSHDTFVARSNAVWEQLITVNPALKEKIAIFQEKYEEKIAFLQQHSWNDLKAALGTKMTQPLADGSISWDQFRNEANHHIETVMKDAIHDLGLPAVQWKAPGTPGYNSDVDIAMEGVNRPLTIDEAYTIKALRDTAHTYMLGGLSGIQLDTECYTPHPAMLNTLYKITVPEAQQQFVTTEQAMALVQGKIGAISDKEGWREFQREELASIDNSERRAVTTAIFDQVDAWFNQMHVDVLRQMVVEHSPDEMRGENMRALVAKIPLRKLEKMADEIGKEYPHAYKIAALNYKTPIMLQIASSSVDITEQLKTKTAEIQAKMKGKASDSNSRVLEQEYDQLLVKHDIYNKLLNCLLDEGTLSQSEGSVTLFRQEGQIDQRLGEKMKIQLKQSMDTVPLRSSSSDHYLQSKEQVVRSRPRLADPTALELTIAAYEEQQQFRHVIHEGLSNPNANAGKVAIQAGKYNLRTVRNKLRAMERIEKEGRTLPPEFYTLKGAMQAAEQKALHLEQCKRKFTLNEVAAKALLMEAIMEHHPEVDKTKLEGDLVELFKMFNPGEGLSDMVLLKRNKMEILVEELRKLGYVANVTLRMAEKYPEMGLKAEIKEKNIELVLRAFVGYKREKDPEIDNLFQKGDKITLDYYDLNSIKHVESNALHVENLSRRWQNMSFEIGIMPKMATLGWVMEEMNFASIWKEAKTQIIGE